MLPTHSCVQMAVSFIERTVHEIHLVQRKIDVLIHITLSQLTVIGLLMMDRTMEKGERGCITMGKVLSILLIPRFREVFFSIHPNCSILLVVHEYCISMPSERKSHSYSVIFLSQATDEKEVEEGEHSSQFRKTLTTKGISISALQGKGIRSGEPLKECAFELSSSFLFIILSLLIPFNAFRMRLDTSLWSNKYSFYVFISAAVVSAGKTDL